MASISKLENKEILSIVSANISDKALNLPWCKKIKDYTFISSLGKPKILNVYCSNVIYFIFRKKLKY